MKKTIAIVLALLLALTCLAGCGSKAETEGASEAEGGTLSLTGKDVFTQSVQIAWIPMSTAGQINTIVQQAADDIMATYSTVSIKFFDCGFDPNTQISLVNECITQGYDAVVMECADSTALGPVIADAEAAGVNIITVNLGCETVHTMHVKCDSYSGGWVSAEAMMDILGGKGDILLLDVPAEQAVSTTFCKGFEEYVKKNNPDANILEYINLAGNAQEDAYNVMRDMLTKYDHIDAVYAPDDNYGLGILQAIQEAGREDENIIVWGTDLQPGGIDSILAGELDGSCWSDRYSGLYTAFSCALYFSEAGITAKSLNYTTTPSIFVRFVAVTQDNINEILPLTRWPGY
jgi:ABC-type sugar transport system substrate-binding protein